MIPYGTYAGIDEGSDAVCASDADLQQLPGDNRQLSPSEKFFFAILEGAMVDYLGTKRQQRRQRFQGAWPTVLQSRAEVWFTSGSTDFLSYRWICAVLGLDPTYVWTHRADWKVVQQENRGDRHQVLNFRREAA